MATNWKVWGIVGAVAAVAVTTAVGFSAQTVQAATVTVYKSATCGCCNAWISHLETNGFTVIAEDRDDLPAVKNQLGVGSGLAACHTAVVEGYVVEGHVPADVIRRLLDEKPAVAGLAVPGMPIGSPGMEGPNPQRYDVLAFHRDGRTEVFARR